ncbi:MAG: Maf-like protein [Nitrospira sp.]|nr:Maf-like protein [Nitrospira sp.]
MQLILASSSPRRQELLALLGCPFTSSRRMFMTPDA